MRELVEETVLRRVIAVTSVAVGIPKELELVGLDIADYEGRYLSDDDVRASEREDAHTSGLI